MGRNYENGDASSKNEGGSQSHTRNKDLKEKKNKKHTPTDIPKNLEKGEGLRLDETGTLLIFREKGETSIRGSA